MYVVGWVKSFAIFWLSEAQFNNSEWFYPAFFGLYDLAFFGLYDLAWLLGFLQSEQNFLYHVVTTLLWSAAPSHFGQ